MKNSTIQRLFDRISSIPFFWELDAVAFRATSYSPYRQRLIANLALNGASRVLDVACGNGLNFALLRNAVSGIGLICGLDQSAKTLELARQRIEDKAFTDIELVEINAPAYKATVPFNAALCTFSIEIIESWKETLDMMIRSVYPGGRIGIIGFKESSRKYFQGLNPVFKRICAPFGIEFNRDVRGYLKKECDEVLYEEVFGGFYYLLIVQKRAEKEG